MRVWKLINNILGKIYLTFAIFIVILAVLVTLLRALTPILTRYKANFTQLAEHYLEKPVEIGRVKAGLRGFQPVLDLHSVLVLNKPKGHVVFRIHDLQVGLDILQSLKQHKIIVSRLYLNGMQLKLQQDRKSDWQVQGLSLQARATGNAASIEFNDILSWLLSQPQLVLEDIDLTIAPYKKRIHHIQDLDLALTNSLTLHQLRGQANLSGHHSPIDLAIDLTGSADAINKLQGHFYLHGVKIPVVSWLNDKSFYGFYCRQGNFSFQLWGNWQNQSFNDLQTKIDFSNVVLNDSSKKKTFNLQNLEAEMAFSYKKSHVWQLSGQNMQVTINGHQWPETEFMLNVKTGKQTQINSTVKYLRLNDITPLLEGLTTIPQKTQDVINALQPHGDLNNIQLQYQQKNKKIYYHLVSTFDQLAMKSYQKIPGYSGLAGKINLNQSQGILQLSTKNANLDYPQLFNEPFVLTNLQSNIQWKKNDKGIELQMFGTKLSDSNFDLLANMQLEIDNDMKKSKIALLSQYNIKHLDQLKTYLPKKMLRKKLYVWLQHAFPAGQAATGKILIGGKLMNFPYVKNRGQFIVDTHLQDLQLNFAKHWPSIDHLTGHLVFHKNMMRFKAESGDLMQQPITSLTATIPDMAAHPQSILAVDTSIKLKQLETAREYIFSSPLKKTIGKSIAPMQFDGAGKLHLKLTVPLHTAKTKVKADLSIVDTQLTFPKWRLQFKHLNGLLHFTDKIVSAKDIRAQFYGKPITTNISTINHNQQHYTQITSRTTMKLSDLKDYFSLHSLRFIDGTTNIKTTVDIARGGDTHVIMSSNFKGVNVAMPSPFGKKPAQARRFHVDAYLHDKQPPLIRIVYGNLVGGLIGYRLHKGESVFDRAVIHFGKGGYLLQKQSGIFLNGNLSNFNWDDWKKFFQTYYNQSTEKKSDKRDSAIKQINMNIGKLEAVHQVINNIHIQISRRVSDWLIYMTSRKISGVLQIPYAWRKQGIFGQFDHLQLQTFEDGKASNLKKLNPNDFIALKLSANDFSYGKKDYGQVTLNMSPIKQGIKIDQLSIVNNAYVLNTHGRWTEANKKDESSFSGSIYTDNLGDLFKKQDFSDHLYQGKGTANFSLSWPGAPSDFQTNSLQGAIQLDFTDGAIIGLGQNTNKKIGLGKLINILSVQSILKRLTLNFSDLDESGYSFSTLRGDLAIKNGNILTNNLYLDGSVAELYLAGKVGLINKDYDIDLKVSPYVTSSLPLIATIAGGPLAGVATWAVSKIARSGIEQVVSYYYHITGTWEHPKIIELKKDNSNSTH